MTFFYLYCFCYLWTEKNEVSPILISIFCTKNIGKFNGEFFLHSFRAFVYTNSFVFFSSTI